MRRPHADFHWSKPIVFKHESMLGNAPARRLFDLVAESRVTEGPACSYADYAIKFDETLLPEGVSVQVYDEIPACI